MNEQIQIILTWLTVLGAAAYTVVVLVRLFTKKPQDGCTSHGCPSCGIKNELKESYARKIKTEK
ncbi:hypothetical protein [Acetobacteroides hydrogenigenes]|uniref:Attachment p12 family protein n=1 Tax=Acetobacteroides hydrogenigenes TaxID=979970 RepID=A0A4R2EQG7_9BACT|nr:hypothetical protein [Acetobacteroides hydrogenigenes]TCN70617.1 hypothetical protein CLV25_103137 [Acetobacteroides hydrogenigenes]